MIRAATTQFARRASPRVFQSRGGGSLPSGAVQQHFFHASPKRDDSDEKKKEVAPSAVTLESTPAPKEGWWNPIYGVPLGITFAVPALHYDWILVNEEMLLAACFIAFTSLIYTQFGGIIKDTLEEDGKRILEEHNKHEDEIIAILQDKIDDLKFQSRVVQDAEDIKALKLATYVKLNAAGKIKPQYDFKAQLERMLTILEAEEISLKEKAKHTLMDEATTAVTKLFATNADLKKQSLANAIATLKGNSQGGADTVQTAYLQYFQTKKVEASKIDEKAETAAARATIITKLNAVAKNEGFFFELDAQGQPKMVV